MPQRLKVGLIGLGEVAQIVHLPVLEALADRFEVTAVCDVSPGLVDLLGHRYNVAGRYHDAAALAADPQVEAVMVLSSDEYHADQTIAGLEYGKHVLVEKPICLTVADAERIIAARDAAGRQVMVGYMRRFAPAFTQAVEEVAGLGPIRYARVRNIIGQNRLIIEQTSTTHRFDDAPAAAVADRAVRARDQVNEAIGEATPDLVAAYRLLCGLGSHDLSAMRELLGVPERVIAASHWHGGRFLTALLAYPGFGLTFEMGIDDQRRFDAHIEVYGATASLRVQYDTPYIRHLPTTLIRTRTVGDSFEEAILRPTLTDPYTKELEDFHTMATTGVAPKTTPEDSILDLRLFAEIMAALRRTVADGGIAAARA